eukprot:CAMPEP_0168466310 /NCGR_PEP_ID=MMETSP0228-20121227/56589_1 /TAXON_ID=133427 /ORGANISM="Protoceratium reticulatum, Strain CCCM 535 (=CCMP 1889)" /LENGTH=49 /DNA_ID= /DNA_START= /DNA_END= /DNA_ORIENTATION=
MNGLAAAGPNLDAIHEGAMVAKVLQLQKARGRRESKSAVLPTDVLVPVR